MKKIFVSDITLRAIAEENNSAVSFREKLNIASLLEKMGVDAIELPYITPAKEDIVVFRTIAESLNSAMVCIACDSTETIKAATECLGKNGCIQISLPVSTVQMEYTYHLKAAKMLEKIAELCKEAKSVCSNVELIARDASRSEAGFIAKCCEAACANGATAITICDDAGVYFPEDFASAVIGIKEACSAKVYVQTSNKLNMAAACAVAAVKAGADGVKTAAHGKEYLSSDTLADIIRAKGEDLGVESKLDITAIHNIVSGVSADTEKSGDILENNDSAVILSRSTLADVSQVIKKLGYDLSDEDIGKVFDEFKRVTAKKGDISERELDAIVASAAMQVPSTYHVVNYVINSGNIITATANITLEKNGETLTGVSTGDGPIDAAFHAIEQIVGFHYELDDFRIQAVTKGREAIGSSVIRLRADGKLYSGNGVSTDILGACIRAYINALNKIVYGEN